MLKTDHSVSLNERVRLERVRMFFGLAKGNMAGILLGTLLIGVILVSGGVSYAVAAIWGGLIGLFSVAIMLYERDVQRKGVSTENCERLLRTRIALGAIVGLLWGVAGYLLPSGNTQVQDTYLFIVLSTLVTVGALGYAAMPAYYLVLDVVTLVPLSIEFARNLLVYGDKYYLLLVVMSAIWQIVVIKKARKVSRMVIDAIVVNERLKDEIEEHKRTKAELQMMAQMDALTGLANRTLFSDRLKQTIALAQRTESRFAQLYIDLDRFKPVNDTFGHAMGDLLLKDVAARIQRCVRDSDTAARIGGDEFVVLLREIASEANAIHVAEKIRQALSEPFLIDGQVIDIGCSIGIATYPEHGTTEIELSKHSDAAMYRAKDAGRNAIRMAAVSQEL